MSDSSIVLATSLSPQDERGVQQTAVQSWMDHGATVLAINTPSEIDTLKASFPNVTFVAALRTAEQHAKRPVPYIFDLLQAAKAHSADGDTIGIINADIYLRPLSGLTNFMTEHARGSVVLGPRVDVNDKADFTAFEDTDNPTYSVGYDYFLMSRDVVDEFADSPFSMGMPFWDYWLPLTAHLAGRPLKTLKSPVALHVSHDTRWDDTIYLFFHALIAYALEQSKTAEASSKPRDRQLSFFLNVLSHHYGFILDNGTSGNGDDTDGNALGALSDFYDRFQEAAVHTIKSQAETIRFPTT